MLISFTKEEVADIKKQLDMISNTAYDIERVIYGHEAMMTTPLWDKLETIANTAVDLYDKFILNDDDEYEVNK